ncbi:EAL domain-containing protein [Vibrio alfacsensis]|uniref:EAL domain-containing protein n=1 Tax=Vibrio alfacsensis TaxID=1074311 RepID=UPI004067EE5A
MLMSGFEQVAPPSDCKSKKLWQLFGIQTLIFFSIQISFSLSNFFVITQDRLHVLSFTGAFVVAMFLRYGWRVFPVIATSLFFYYVAMSDRSWQMALLFSVALPILPAVFCQVYRIAINNVSKNSITTQLGYYAIIIGVLYPLANTALLFSILYCTDVNCDFKFAYIAYSVLSAILTNMVLTPLISLGISYVLDGDQAPYVKLDGAMMAEYSTPLHYRLWLMNCALLLVAALSTTDLLTLNTLTLMLLFLASMGLGKFGILRPMLITAATILICVESIVNRHNTGLIQYEHLYAMLLVLFVLTMLIFMLGVHAIKNFLETRGTNHKERIDSFTGLYNLAQFKEDVAMQPNATLIYIDLQPTLSKLNGLGHQGCAQLMKQLNQYLASHTQHLKRAYLPPFSNGLLCFTPDLPYINAELKKLITLLDGFYFYFDESKISLVRRTVQCATLTDNDHIDNLISKLCEQGTSDNACVNWIANHHNERSAMNQLSFIQRCFREDRFELYCQPYQALIDREQPAHFEILLRLKPSHDHLMSPAEFFPLINAFGLELELDEWVIEHTFEALEKHVRNWDCIGLCSINLTAKALNFDSLATRIQTQAKAHRIPMAKLCFEITESDFLRNESIAIQNLNLLRQSGCTIALDDFGTGYASFDYLRRLPLDVLKVDGSFVKNITQSENDRIIVQAISQVASSMRLITVAEFVESEQHIDTLKALDIHFAQGFGVAKPMPLIDYLTTQSNKP